MTPRLYNRGRFLPLRRKRFILTNGKVSWSVRLVKVSDIAGGARRDPRRFALTFTSSRRGPTQGTFTLKRPGFTPTTLFVVPSDDANRTYQAVINRR